MLSIAIIAAYMAAFLCDKRALTLLFACVCCEFIGWSPLFKWAQLYCYGVLNFTMWAVIYASYALLENPRGKLLISCAFMVLFQFTMSIDSGYSNGAKTFLYIYYEYILVAIHCCIVSAFIQRGKVISIMGGIVALFRVVSARYGFNVVFWYNNIINQKT